MAEHNLKGKRYIALVRCSSPGQVDTSIDDQLRVIRSFGDEQGGIFIDVVALPALSGSVTANMDAVIDDLIRRKQERNDFDEVLFHDGSRLTRGGIDHNGALHYRMRQAGIGANDVVDYTPNESMKQ